MEEAFRNLFSLVANKDGWVAEAWEEVREGGSWNPCFSRHFNDWELVEVETLFRKLCSLVVKREVKDKLSWNENKSSEFSVRSLYGSFPRGPREPFPASIVWRTWAPMKVGSFVWEVS